MSSKANGSSEGAQQRDAVAPGSTVMVITGRRTFAGKVAKQLGELGYGVELFTPEQAKDISRLAKTEARVLLVDAPGSEEEDMPLHLCVAAAKPASQIILICDSADINRTAQVVRAGEAFDFVCVDSVGDTHRLPLVVEWAFDERSAHGAHVEKTIAEPKSPSKAPADDSPPIVTKPASKATASPPPQLDCRATAVSPPPGGDPFGELERLAIRQILPAHVLVVDDDDVSATIASGLLESFGFTVDVAANAEVAMRVLSNKKTDLVLMDVHLDHANGLELVLTLREGLMCPDVPVIVVTADRTRGTLADALGVIVQGYILKPYESAFMVRKVCSVLHACEGLRIDENRGAVSTA